MESKTYIIILALVLIEWLVCIALMVTYLVWAMSSNFFSDSAFSMMIAILSGYFLRILSDSTILFSKD